MDGDDVQARLKVVRLKFAAGLEARVEELAAAVAEATVARSAEALRRAQAMAHRLHGTSGTMGFEEVGEAAARVDRLVQALLGDGESAARWSELGLAVEALRGHAAAVAVSEQGTGV